MRVEPSYMKSLYTLVLTYNSAQLLVHLSSAPFRESTVFIDSTQAQSRPIPISAAPVQNGLMWNRVVLGAVPHEILSTGGRY